MSSYNNGNLMATVHPTPPLHPDENPSPTSALHLPSPLLVAPATIAPVAPPSPTYHHTLVVCDFDWTLIDCDSDELALHAFGGERAVAELQQKYAQGGVWCELVAEELARQFEQRDHTLDSLRMVLRAAPMHARTRDMLRDLHARGCVVVILSDANEFFIETILEANNVRHTVHSIITNRSSLAKTQSNRDILQVHPLQGPHDPHGCPRKCPSNLCKSTMLARFLASWTASVQHYNQQQQPRILYLGDGMNDFCPISAGQVNVAFVRRGKKLHAALVKGGAIEVAGPEKATAEGRIRGAPVPSDVVLWDCGADLYEKVVDEVEGR